MRNKKKNVPYESNVAKRNSEVKSKSFLKAEICHADYSQSKFSRVSFKNARVKFSSFYSANFSLVDFSGANLKGCNFSSARFRDVIFSNTILDGATFADASFKNTYFICTNIERAKNFPSDKPGIIFIDKFPAENEFSEVLLDAVDKAHTNEAIRASHIFYGKGKRNTLALKILLNTFSEEELVNLLILASSKTFAPIINVWDFQKCLTKILQKHNNGNGLDTKEMV